MPEPSSLAAITAAVETIAPPVDDLPGGVELGVQRHVADMIDTAFPGFVDLIAVLLDAFAADRGAAFADLDPDGRTAVLRTMAEDDSPDVNEVVSILLVFTYGGVYSEWSGHDRATGALVPPQSWRSMGFRGPSRGHADYREGG